MYKPDRIQKLSVHPSITCGILGLYLYKPEPYHFPWSSLVEFCAQFALEDRIEPGRLGSNWQVFSWGKSALVRVGHLQFEPWKPSDYVIEVRCWLINERCELWAILTIIALKYRSQFFSIEPTNWRRIVWAELLVLHILTTIKIIICIYMAIKSSNSN